MKTFLIILMFVGATTCSAVEYQLQVEQHGTNLFKLADEDLFLQTEYCFVDVGTAEALVILDGGSGQIHFSNENNRNTTSCDVAIVYGRVAMKGGNYNVAVTKADDDWYLVDGKAAALLTNGCIESAESTHANLSMGEAGIGILSIADDECFVAGVYGPVSEQ